MQLTAKLTHAIEREGAVVAAGKAFRYPLKPLFVPGAVRALRRVASESESFAEDVALARSFKYAGISITAWQVPQEIVPFLELLAEDRPRAVLEIGTAQGGLLFLLARAAAADAVLVSVDLPRGAFGGGYAAWRAPLYRGFARDRQRIELVRADSHSPRAEARVRRALAGRPVDVLFIDGDHTYEGVRSDFERYGPLVRDGGVVAFHDIVPGRHESVGGVPDYWREVRGRHQTCELVHDWQKGSCGIGVLRLDAARGAAAT